MKIDTLIREHLKGVTPYSSARDEYSNSDGVFLDANENPFGQYNRYPDPYQSKLKQRLAEIKDCKVDQLFIGNGSDEVIDLSLRIFCEPGQDRIIAFTPSYGMYKVSASINNVNIISIPLLEDFQIDLPACRAQFEKAKLLFLCSPNNPTGNIMKADDIEAILAEFKGIVVIDEAYIEFSDENSWANRTDEFNNLIVMQTLSKAWGLASARVGMAFASEEIITLFNRIKPPYNVSRLNQECALNQLADLAEFHKNKDLIIKERKRMVDALLNLSLVKKVYPSQSNFLLAEVVNANGIYSKLVDQSIIVRNRHSAIKNCLRFTIGSEEENNQLLNALSKLENEKSTFS